MQLELLFQRPPRPGSEYLQVGAQAVPLVVVKNRRARRYILRVQSNGSVRLTIPRGGSAEAARDFARRQAAWVQKQLHRRATQSHQPPVWTHGSEILFRGERAGLIVSAAGREARFAGQVVPLAHANGDLRPMIERHLWRLAAAELPPRVLELAARHQLAVRQVRVRNQRSRWGSCSVKGTVSLNWRLIQTPAFVRDYLILHELMHLREMNHSRRFWRWVAQACPQYPAAEAWLNQHSDLLR